MSPQQQKLDMLSTEEDIRQYTSLSIVAWSVICIVFALSPTVLYPANLSTPIHPILTNTQKELIVQSIFGAQNETNTMRIILSIKRPLYNS